MNRNLERILKKTISKSLIIGLTVGAAASSAQQLEEVIVTAERRQSSVQETPVAVSAYTAEMMETLQIENTLDLIHVVPNLFGGNNTGLGTATMYFLRGQGNDESIATFDPAVGTYVDDVYVTRQNANNFSLFDVERIEVLRGPQGTLYGRNTTGGAVSIIMQKPSSEQGGYVEIGAGNYGRQSVRASIDIPMSDKLLTKFSAFTVQDDGWLENTANGKTYNDMDNVGYRAALTYLISDDATWNLSIDNTETSLAYVYGAMIGGDRVSTSTTTVQGVPAGATLKSNGYGNDVEAFNITSNLSWGMGTGDGSLIVGYRELDQKFLLNFPNTVSDDFFAIDNAGQHDMFSLELKWGGSIMDDKAFLTTGVYYMSEENTTDFADYLDYGGLGIPGLPPGSFIAQLADRKIQNDTESLSVYAQVDYKVGEKGTLTLGTRWTDDTKEIDFTGSITTQMLIDAGVPTQLNTGKMTPRIAYSIDISEDVMTYVSATKGFKSGGWNSRATSGPAAASFDAEQLWSYEVGLRGDYMDGRLRTNFTAFYTDLEDLQTTSITPDGTFLTKNAGGMEVLGLEAEVTALPTDNWQIFLAMGLQDAEYFNLPDGCVTPNTSFAAFDENCNAADPKRTPESTYTLGTHVSVPMNGMTLKPYAMMRYIGENVTGTRGQGPNSAETIINAGVSLTSADDTWTLNLECKNCSDNEYTTSNLFVPYLSHPRTYMATLKWNFGN